MNSTMKISTSPITMKYQSTYDETLSCSSDEECAADDGADERAEPADHHHDDELARDRPQHEVGRREGRAAGIEGAADTGEERGDHADGHLVALDVVAEEPRAVLVLADRHQHPAEVRGDEHAADEVGEPQVDEDEVVVADRRVDGEAGGQDRRRQRPGCRRSRRRSACSGRRCTRPPRRSASGARSRCRAAPWRSSSPPARRGRRRATAKTQTHPEREDAALEQDGGRSRRRARRRRRGRTRRARCSPSGDRGSWRSRRRGARRRRAAGSTST